MGIMDRLFGRSAVKALDKPAWWGNVWATDEVSSANGEYGDSASGRIGAVKHNVWAYNCVQARMAAVAQAPMKLYHGYGQDKEEIHEHPVIDLLRFVNPVNLNARSFRRGMEQQLSLHGRCLIQKVRGLSGVSELYILPMNYIEIQADPRMWISGFIWLPTNAFIPRADVIDLSYPSLSGDVYADSPTSAALDVINRYNLADMAQASVDRRGGQKGGMVIHPQQTTPIDFDRARIDWDRWRKNPQNAGRDMHVSAGFDYRADAFSASEMQREERMNRIAKEIMAPFRIPPAAAGDFSDASVLANAAVQMRAVWDLFAVDECGFIAEELTYSLLHAEWPEAKAQGLYFEHDLSQIPAMREDNDSRVQRAIALNASNLASVNEARDIAGLDKSEDPSADRILMEASQADVVADTAPLMAIIAARNAGAFTDAAAATLLRIAAPNLSDEQLTYLLSRDQQVPVINAPAQITDQQTSADMSVNQPGELPAAMAVDTSVDNPFLPPSSVRESAALGLKLREEFNRGGTMVGVARARDLSNGKRISPETINRMLSYFARHAIDKQADGWGDESNPSAGYIAWLLWGGDAGLQWINGIEKEYPSETKAFPYVDPVGLVAESIDGDELGIIDALHRGGVHDGIKATIKVPVFSIAGKAYDSTDVMVRHA